MYASGCVRVFDVESTDCLHEIQQHRAAVTKILYSSDGSRLFSAGTKPVVVLLL